MKNKVELIIRIEQLTSEYFRKKRKESGFTGKQVGQILSVSQQQISRYEKGITCIPLSVLIYFLVISNSSIEKFFMFILNNIQNNPISKTEVENFVDTNRFKY